MGYRDADLTGIKMLGNQARSVLSIFFCIYQGDPEHGCLLCTSVLPPVESRKFCDGIEINTDVDVRWQACGSLRVERLQGDRF